MKRNYLILSLLLMFALCLNFDKVHAADYYPHVLKFNSPTTIVAYRLKCDGTVTFSTTQTTGNVNYLGSTGYYTVTSWTNITQITIQSTQKIYEVELWTSNPPATGFGGGIFGTNSYLSTDFPSEWIDNNEATGSSSYTLPTVSLVTPANGRLDVDISESVNITFNENIKDTGTATLLKVSNNTAVPTTKTVVNNQIKLVPDSKLEYNTNYKVVLSGYNSVSKNLTMNNFTSKFKTVNDTTPLEVVYIKPPPESVDVPLDTKVEIKFNKVVNPSTISNIAIKREGIIVPISKTLESDIIFITFEEELLKDSKYEIVIKDVTDNLGNGLLSPLNVYFSTVTDNTELLLLEYNPPSGIIPLTQQFEFKFNKNVDPESVLFTFKKESGQEAPVTYNVIGNRVVFTPVLESDTKYDFVLLEAKTLNGIRKEFNTGFKFQVLKITDVTLWDNITNSILKLFISAKSNGMLIIIAAIGLLLFSIASVWIYKKLKLWLKKS